MLCVTKKLTTTIEKLYISNDCKHQHYHSNTHNNTLWHQISTNGRMTCFDEKITTFSQSSIFIHWFPYWNSWSTYIFLLFPLFFASIISFCFFSVFVIPLQFSNFFCCLRWVRFNILISCFGDLSDLFVIWNFTRKKELLLLDIVPITSIYQLENCFDVQFSLALTFFTGTNVIISIDLISNRWVCIDLLWFLPLLQSFIHLFLCTKFRANFFPYAHTTLVFLFFRKRANVHKIW